MDVTSCVTGQQTTLQVVNLINDPLRFARIKMIRKDLSIVDFSTTSRCHSASYTDALSIDTSFQVIDGSDRVLAGNLTSFSSIGEGAHLSDNCMTDSSLGLFRCKTPPYLRETNVLNWSLPNPDNSSELKIKKVVHNSNDPRLGVCTLYWGGKVSCAGHYSIKALSPAEANDDTIGGNYSAREATPCAGPLADLRDGFKARCLGTNHAVEWGAGILGLQRFRPGIWNRKQGPL